MPSAELRGQRVHYQDAGDGPALILSHGFLMDSDMFVHQVEALADRFRVITWDQRGHGRTEFDGGHFSYWDSADDLLALMDHLGLERAVLGGMSAGGFISLRAALRQPERVRGLVLIDTQAGLEDPANVPSYDSMYEVWVNDGPSDQLLAMVSAIIVGEYERDGDWIAKWRDRPIAEFAPVYRNLMDRDDITERLPEISAPALVLHGERDAAIPLERAQALCSGLGRCRGLVVVPEAGHASNLVRPEPVNAAMSEFLASLHEPIRPE